MAHLLFDFPIEAPAARVFEPEGNEHHRVSCSCRAMDLRLLRRSVGAGEIVPYARRLEV